MSDLVCIICHEGAAPNKSLISNPEMIEHLYESCKERLSLGQADNKLNVNLHTTTVSTANQLLIEA